MLFGEFGSVTDNAPKYLISPGIDESGTHSPLECQIQDLSLVGKDYWLLYSFIQ